MRTVSRLPGRRTFVCATIQAPSRLETACIFATFCPTRSTISALLASQPSSNDSGIACLAFSLFPNTSTPVVREAHFEVLLDDDHGVAAVGEGVQHRTQLLGVVEVQARRRLVEDVQSIASCPSRELARELDALGLAA
jgi:hypothetical protein